MIGCKNCATLETALHDAATALEEVYRGTDEHKTAGFAKRAAASARAALAPASPAVATNAGMKCDTDSGPCACGAWHGITPAGWKPDTFFTSARKPAETQAPTRNMTDPETREFWEKTQARADAFAKREPSWMKKAETQAQRQERIADEQIATLKEIGASPRVIACAEEARTKMKAETQAATCDEPQAGGSFDAYLRSEAPAGSKTQAATCEGCAKVDRHPGEGYKCIRHPDRECGATHHHGWKCDEDAGHREPHFDSNAMSAWPLDESPAGSPTQAPTCGHEHSLFYGLTCKLPVGHGGFHVCSGPLGGTPMDDPAGSSTSAGAQCDERCGQSTSECVLAEGVCASEEKAMIVRSCDEDCCAAAGVVQTGERECGCMCHEPCDEGCDVIGCENSGAHNIDPEMHHERLRAATAEMEFGRVSAIARDKIDRLRADLAAKDAEIAELVAAVEAARPFANISAGFRDALAVVEKRRGQGGGR